MLFLDTLYVSASSTVTNIFDLLDSTNYIEPAATTYNVSMVVDGDLTSLTLGSGTYSGSSSGTSSGTYSGSSSGTYSGEDIPITYSSYAPLSGTSATGSYQGSFSGTTSSTGTQSGAESGTISVNVYGTVVENHVDYDSSGDISTTDSGTTTSTLSSTQSGTISFSSSSNSTVVAHLKLPIDMRYAKYSTTGIVPSDYYCFLGSIQNFTANSGNGYARNIILTDTEGNILNVSGNSNPEPKFVVGTDLLSTGTSGYEKYGIYGFLEFDYYLSNSTGGVYSCSFGIYHRLFHVKSEYQSTVGASVVSDTVAHEIQQSTLESSQAIEESVTSETGTGLLATIKNFFGSFFSNIINSFISLFVPSSDYFSTWFDNLNNLLSDKLGMLYAPFDFIISILNSVYSADTSEPSIPFPAITWDGTTLVSAQNLKFSELLGDNYSTLQGYVYFGTDTVLLFAFLYLLQRKIALILTGSEANG